MFVASLGTLAAGEGALRVLGLGDPIDGTDLVQRWDPPEIYEADAAGDVRLRPGYDGAQVYTRATDGVELLRAPTHVGGAGLREEGGREDGRVVLAVGDSTTFGVGVGDGQSWPAALERTLPDGWRVANAGVPGRNLAQAVAWLRGPGRKVAASRVLLAFYANDLMPSLPVSASVPALRLAAPPWATPEAGLRRASRLYNLWARRQERRRTVGTGGADYLANITRFGGDGDLVRELDRLRHTCAERGAEPFVVLLPVLDLPDPHAADALYARVARVAEDLGIPVVHAEGSLDPLDLPERVVLPGEHHASARGNAAIAAAVRAAIPWKE